MAEQTVHILQGAIPNNEDVYFAPISEVAATNPRGADVLVCEDGSTRVGAEIVFPVPKDYDSGTAPTIRIRWATVPIVNDVVLDVDYRALAVGESDNQSGNQETATVTDTANGTTHLISETEITLTAANFAVDDIVYLGFFFDRAEAAHDLAAQFWVHTLEFVYDDGA